MVRHCTKCRSALSPGDSFCEVCGTRINARSVAGGQAVIGPGTQIREYRFIRLLGQGAVGRVYLAHDSLGREVAIKVVVPSLTTTETVRQRFLSGGKITAALEHRHIVRVHTYFEEQGAHFLVMEYVPGKPLDMIIQEQGRLPLQETIRITCGVLDALEYAHAQNPALVHRDIKPANILIEPGSNGRVVVTDFDIAKFQGAQRETQLGSFVGTPSYIAPEQAKGKAPLPASDIYSLGITIFEMLAGHVPFGQEGNDYLGVLVQHINSPVPRLPNRPDIPRPVCKVIEKALAKKPEDRHHSAAAFRKALQEALTRKISFPAISIAGAAGLLTLLIAIGLGTLHYSGQLDDWRKEFRKLVKDDSRHQTTTDETDSKTIDDTDVSVAQPNTDLTSNMEPDEEPSQEDEDKELAGVIVLDFSAEPVEKPSPVRKAKRKRAVKHGLCDSVKNDNLKEIEAIGEIRSQIEKGTRNLDGLERDGKEAVTAYRKAKTVLDSASSSVRNRCKGDLLRLKKNISRYYLDLTRRASGQAQQSSSKTDRERNCTQARNRAADARKFGASDSEINEALGECENNK